MSIPAGDPGVSGYLGGYSPGPVPGTPSPEDNKYGAGPTDSRARNALILGVLGITPVSILAGVPAIVTGTHALRHINASEGELKGRGVAWSGIVLGCLSVALFVTLLYVVYG